MIYISIGSNIGHRLHHLQQAVALLGQRCLKHITPSIVLETTCILPEGAPLAWDKPFLNMVVAGESDASPEELLRTLKQIERDMGRPATYERWAPRVIDLDILMWDDMALETPHLTIPHPELNNRPFLTHLLALMGTSYQKEPAPQDCFIKSFCLFPSFMGIVNVTPDSFSDGGLYDGPERAIEHALKLARDGAMVIDIGAQSTRPGATLNTPEHEYALLKPVLDGLQPFMAEGTLTVSVDTFWPSTIRQILETYDIAWINDQSGALDDVTLALIAARSCTLCVMHALSIPPTQQKILPHDRPPMDYVIDWGRQISDRLLTLGFNPEQVILDPGVGFGKSPYQNLNLMRHITPLKQLGHRVLVGHSRKGYMRTFSVEEAPKRDLETIAHSLLLAPHVDYLRVHHVADHHRFFVAHQLLQKGYQS